MSFFVWDPRQKLAARELRSTARPLQQEPPRVAKSASDVQDTLACDMSPLAASYTANPPAEPVLDDKKPPPLGKRYDDLEPTVLFGSGEPDSKPLAPSAVAVQESSGGDGATSEKQVVVDEPPEKVGGQSKTDKADDDDDDDMDDLFHSTTTVTRLQQMEEKDKLAAQNKNKSNPDAEEAESTPTEPTTKKQKAAATKQRKAEAKQKAKQAAKEKAKEKKAVAKAKAKAKKEQEKLFAQKKKELAKKAAAKAKASTKKSKGKNNKRKQSTAPDEAEDVEENEAAPAEPMEVERMDDSGDVQNAPMAAAAPEPVAPQNDHDVDAVSSKANCGDGKNEKITFARRYRPSRPDAGKRWDGIQSIFVKHVKNNFKNPGSFEVRVLKTLCLSMFRV